MVNEVGTGALLDRSKSQTDRRERALLAIEVGREK